MPINQPPNARLQIPATDAAVNSDATVSTATSIPTGQPTEQTATSLPATTPQPTKDIVPNPNNDIIFAPTATPFSGGLPTFDSLTPLPEKLTLDYKIDWHLTQDPNFALANVTLDVSGGEEPYTYYRDDVNYPNPNFSYRWGSCRNNPGRFRVVDAAGTTAELLYFEKAPCPPNSNQ